MWSKCGLVRLGSMTPSPPGSQINSGVWMLIPTSALDTFLCSWETFDEWFSFLGRFWDSFFLEIVFLHVLGCCLFLLLFWTSLIIFGTNLIVCCLFSDVICGK